MKISSWIARIVAAVILLQTLYFKFTGAAESVYIFTTIGMEPWGRIGSGVAELVAAVLLLVPATAWLGALLALGNNDRGRLFAPDRFGCRGVWKMAGCYLVSARKLLPSSRLPRGGIEAIPS
ncbi:hypothetical protein C900_04078 [Fulvivirga imtechensis AK7]|uniref:DoxX family protein n=1 Tax=Fulvivirga imtechensis AK7 TaxID=1237149 RepID=L8JMD0_9BACT|nr:hypothetical protein [Fulvivirga imtechensis]ELR70081.1 hypothetical protein C900_04078 [Fulvivirga imtechensis AK7]